MLSKELFKPLMIVAGVTFGTLALAACEEEPAEEVGEAIEEGAEETGEAVEEAGEEAQQ